MLTGSTRVKERRSILEGLASGDIDIVVGTHAVLQDAVAFKSLGVGVIDEQHRCALPKPGLQRACTGPHDPCNHAQISGRSTRGQPPGTEPWMWVPLQVWGGAAVGPGHEELPAPAHPGNDGHPHPPHAGPGGPRGPGALGH